MIRPLALLLVLVGTVGAAWAERNNGTDPTRPRTHVLGLYDFQNLPGRAPDSQSTFTLRGIQRFKVAERWSGSLRLDVPLVVTNAPGGDFVFGSGNLLVQAAAIYTLNDRWAFAAGSQVTFPTASRDATGSGKYVALPGAVVRRMLPELSDGSFFAPEMLYAFDVGGDPEGSHTSELQLQPTLDWELPRGVFLQLFPSSDIRIDLGQRPGRGRLFFPFDILAGMMITPRLLTSLEVSVPIVQDYPVYDFKLEATVAYFFD